MGTIGLSMIVWNEADVVARAIASIKDHLDYYCIVIDTKTTDNSYDVIKEALQGVEGEIIYKEWEGFDSQRNAALAPLMGKVDWALILDADEVFILKDFTRDKLDINHWAYISHVQYGIQSFDSIRIININHPWQWRAKIHNYLECEGYTGAPTIESITVHHFHDGHRSRLPDKVATDIEILRKTVEEEPDNARYLFYLAQTVRESGNYDEAIPLYQKRVSMGGWEEERWYSQYMIAKMYYEKDDWINTLNAALVAYDMKPDRAEPLYLLCIMSRGRQYRNLHYLWSKLGIRIPYPKEDLLFVDDHVYKYQMQFEHGISSYYKGYYQESFEANKKALSCPELLDGFRGQLEENMRYTVEALKKNSLLEFEEDNRIRLYLIDKNFDYSLEKFGFDSCTHGVNQKEIEWIRLIPGELEPDNKDIPIVITDFCISVDLVKKYHSKGFKVWLWLLEPRARLKHIYEEAEFVAGTMIDGECIAERIFTFDEDMLERYPNTEHVVPGGCWAGGKQTQLMFARHQKTMMTSICGTHKMDSQYHRFKTDLITHLLPSYNVDIYGVGEYDDPSRYLHNYRFTIVVENNVECGYFTEKLLNAFATFTVPIYFGAPDVEQYFNPNGIIRFTNADELRQILNNLTVEDYENRIAAMRENALLVYKYETRERSLRKTIEKIRWYNPFDYFDHIYILVASWDEARRKNALKIHESLNIIDPDKVSHFNAIKNANGGLGCKLSYRGIIKDASDNGYEKILVIEDDAKLIDEHRFVLSEALSTIDVFPWEHLKLYANVRFDAEYVTPYLYRISHTYSTTACAFHKRSYQWILDNVSSDPAQEYRTYIDAIDRIISEEMMPNGQCYVVGKPIFEELDMQSTIEARDKSSYDLVKNHMRLYVNAPLIYYNEGMKTFGDNYVKLFGFKRIPLDLTNISGLLWFGVYSEAEYDALLSVTEPINFHWCGSDVLYCLSDTKRVRKLAQMKHINHTCENTLQQRELSYHGIGANIAPMFSEHPQSYELQEGEKTFDVCIYTPEKHELYNIPLMLEVVREMPDYTFAFIGDQGLLKNLPPNVTNFQWVGQDEVKSVLAMSKIYLRITSHDAFADLTIKATLLGLHVITNHDLPGISNVVPIDKTSIIETIKKLRDAPVDPNSRNLYLSNGFLNDWEKILRYDF